MFRLTLLLLTVSGLVTAQTVGQQCSNLNNPCADGSGCGNGVCGSWYTPCTTGSQCVSGVCDTAAAFQHCTAVYQLGDAGCPLGTLTQSGYSPNTNLNCITYQCNDQGICGGDGTFAGVDCDNGQNACASDVCASGIQIGIRCAAQHLSRSGDKCDISEQCPVGVDCTGGICGGAGSCSPDDTTTGGNGPSSYCDTGDICIDNQCGQPLPVGYSCTSSLQCGGDSGCANGECGGDGAACTPSRLYTPGGTDGPSTQCSSNYCSDSICGDDPISNRCFSSAQCDGNRGCGTDSICGGEGASCAPDSYSPDLSGYSTLCQPARSCYNGACRFDGSIGVGGSCSATDLCSPNLHCISGTCKNELPANTGSYCSDDSGCTGATTCVDSECVLTAPGQSDKPITRRDQLAWTEVRCPRGGEIACPVANGGGNAYEVCRVYPYPT